MSIKVRFFASIRERVGKDEASVEAVDAMTVSDVWQRVTDLPLPVNTLTAINQEYAQPQQLVRDGDEVAFFPPVTGGGQ